MAWNGLVALPGAPREVEALAHSEVAASGEHLDAFFQVHEMFSPRLRALAPISRPVAHPLVGWTAPCGGSPMVLR
jgi:hypothetical protein